MIAARLENGNGEVIVLFVLEPGNLEKLKRGEPIHKMLNDFVPGLSNKTELLLAYTPDIDWVSEQWQAKLKEGPCEAGTLAEIVSESLTRRSVIDRSQSGENMRRVP